MSTSISEVLTCSVAVAISPVPIIAVILMLFSTRARVNGPMFLAGWIVAAGAVSAIAYVLADAGDAATDTTTADTISWGQIAIGAFLLVVAARQWRRRAVPGAQPELPKWMAGIDSFSPGKSSGGRHRRLARGGRTQAFATGRTPSRAPHLDRT